MDCSLINYQEVLYRVDGNTELLKKIVNLYLKISPSLLIRIEEGIQNHNGLQVRQAAHNLKGMVSNFAALPVMETILDLEKMGEMNDFSQMSTRFETLKTELENLNNALLYINNTSNHVVSL